MYRKLTFPAVSFMACSFSLYLLGRVFKMCLFSQPPVFKVQNIHVFSQLNLLLVTDTKKYLQDNLLLKSTELNMDCLCWLVMNFLLFFGSFFFSHFVHLKLLKCSVLFWMLELSFKQQATCKTKWVVFQQRWKEC